MELTRHTADRIKLCAEHHIDKRAADSLPMEGQIELVNAGRDRLIMQLTAYVTAMPKERIKVDVEEKWPATWRDAVKERWFPAWALKRWPVERKAVSIHIDEQKYGPICPHLHADPADKHFEFLVGGE